MSSIGSQLVECSIVLGIAVISFAMGLAGGIPLGRAKQREEDQLQLLAQREDEIAAVKARIEELRTKYPHAR